MTAGCTWARVFRPGRQDRHDEIATAVIVATTTVAAQGPRAAAPIPVMLLDGESAGRYHDWPRVTAALKTMLDETGLFAVTVVTAPPVDR